MTHTCICLITYILWPLEKTGTGTENWNGTGTGNRFDLIPGTGAAKLSRVPPNAGLELINRSSFRANRTDRSSMLETIRTLTAMVRAGKAWAPVRTSSVRDC